MNEEELKEHEKRLEEKEKRIEKMQEALEKEKQEYLRMAMEREKRLQEEMKELEEKGANFEGNDVVEAMMNYQRDIIKMQEKIIVEFMKKHPENLKKIIKDLNFTKEDLEKIDALIQMIRKEKKIREVKK